MIVRFGDFELDEELYELRHRGGVVPLEPKPFDVLRHLIASREGVVSKDALLGAVWPGEYVTESVLHRCVSLVRKALSTDGDGEKGRSLLVTVRGRGYRFTGAVESADVAPTSREARPGRIPVHEVFLGRDPVLSELQEQLAAASSGHGRVVLLVGDPGIGKTRTAEALLSVLPDGVPALVGRCFEGDGAPPYWPWVQVLRGITERTEDPATSTLLARLEGTAGEVEGSEREQRFRLFDGIARSLDRASRGHAAVLVLEDLHWADTPSLLVLQNLAHALVDRHLLLIATLRDERRPRDDPFARMRGQLSRLGHVHRIALSGLDREQVERFLALTLGREPPGPLVDAVYERTEGNPLFLREVVRWILAQPQADWAELVPSWDVVLPDGLRDVIERRIDALGTPVARVLEAAAVIGRSFDPVLLAEVLGEERTLVDPCLEDARAARVIEAEGHGYTFSHALVRETLLEALPLGARVDWHWRVGEGLEKRHAEDLEPVLGELAHHFFEAHPLGGQRALQYAEAAAEAAARRLGWEEAAAHLERAIALLDRMGARDRERLLRLLRGLGAAHRAVGDVAATRASFSRAANLADELGDGLAYAQHVLDAMGPGSWGPIDKEAGDRAFARALERLPQEPSVLGAQLLARQAIHVREWNDFEDSLGLSARALEAARGLDDEITLSGALMTRVACLMACMHEPGGLQSYDAAIDEVSALVRLESSPREVAGDHLQLRQWRAGRALLVADGPGFRHEQREALILSAASRHPMEVWSSLHVRASLALLEGRHEEAQRNVVEAFRIGSRFSLPWSGPGFLGASLELARATGKLPAVADQIRTFTENFPLRAPLLRAIELAVPAEAGRPELSRAGFEAWAAEGFERLRRDHEWLLVATDLATVACALGAHQSAEILYEQLLPYAGMSRALWDINVYMGPVAGSLSELALLLGRSREAREHAEAALGSARGLGAATYASLALNRLERLVKS